MTNGQCKQYGEVMTKGIHKGKKENSHRVVTLHMLKYLQEILGEKVMLLQWNWASHRVGVIPV
jgi:hypothetical protein